MNHFEFNDAFLRMEFAAQEVADAFCHNGCKLWPYLRAASFSVFYRGDRSREGRLCKPYVKVKNLEILPFGYKILSLLAKGSIIIWSRGACHTQIVRGRQLDPYLDPVYSECRRLGLSALKLKMDYSEVPNPVNPGIDLPIFQNAEKIVQIKEVANDENYRNYVKLSRDNGVPHLYAAELMNYFFAVESYRKLYLRVLDILRPRMLVLEEYYNASSMGLAHACRDLGIPCVEYQHGLQEWPHMAYNFPVMPESGWNTVPEWFFMWGEPAARNMRKWCSGQGFHKIQIAGKPSHIAWKNGELTEDRPLMEEFERRLHGRVPVCVALPLFDCEDKIGLLREMIASSPREWIWLLRHHPLHKSNELAFMDGLGDRLESDLCSRINLHDVLAKSRHLLTAVSTTAHEAVALHGMHATTISGDGKKYFWKDISEGNVEYAGTVREALDSIARGVAGYPWKAEKPYITADINAMGRAIQNVLAGT